MSAERSGEVIKRERSLITPAAIEAAAKRLEGITIRTPLNHSPRLSSAHGARIFLKDETQQPVRSYKIRGAANRMAIMTDEERERGVVTASAGNHAQGVALSAANLGIMADIVMPRPTPHQKIGRVRHFGGDFARIHLEGATFDDAAAFAREMCSDRGAVYVPPFNDPHVIAGQGTVGLEILEQAFEDGVGPIDTVVVPIGGGGLISGLGIYFSSMSPNTRVIGVEPAGAAAMKASMVKREVVTLASIDPFVDGAAVRTPGDLTFEVAQEVVDDIVVVSEGEVCEAMMDMYNFDGKILEPAGALSVAALRKLGDDIRDQTVVSILSGSNIGAERMAQVIQRANEAAYARSPFSICI